METAEIARIGVIVMGFLVIAASFWFHAVKKLTVNLAVIWEFLGLFLILVGIVPVLSAWAKLVSNGTVAALLIVGGICLLAGFEISLMISRLIMENKELNMQVSLLLLENEIIIAELEESEKDMRKNGIIVKGAE